MGQRLPDDADRDGTPAWMLDAACRGMDPDIFHPARGATLILRRALAVCAVCRVSQECLTYALDHNIDVGVWGGTTGESRRTELRRLRRIALRARSVVAP